MVPVPPWCQHLPTVLPYLTPQPPAAHRAAFTSCLHPHSLDPIYSHSYLCVCACVCVSFFPMSHMDVMALMSRNPGCGEDSKAF